MDEIKLTIDGREITASIDQTILEAALAAGIYIPHLCYHPSLPHAGECKLCVVEIEGEKEACTSCTTRAADGMRVTTKSEGLLHIRRLSMELMMASHPSECTSCPKYLKCELQALTQYLGVSDSRLRKLPGNEYVTDENPLMIRDLVRCVLCGRCVRACRELRGAQVLDFHRDGTKTWVAPQKGAGLLKDGDCRFCGACVAVCPTGAIRDKDEVFAEFDTERQALVPCRSSCPAGTDVPAYLTLIRQGDYAGALAVIRERVPFPLTLGHVCMRFCETACRRKDVNEAVSIRELKKFAAEQGGEKWKSQAQNAPQTGKRVAIIGAGPAGMTAAYYLARKGHAAEVFERLPEAGGMLRAGIPQYRLPAEIVQKEIDDILEAGVKIQLSTEAEAPAKLLEQGFDAVVVAIGAHKGKRLPVPGGDLPNVTTAVDFLRGVAMGEKADVGKRVAVLGGGNVAFDCARTALRLGAEQVTVMCLEPRDGMAASADEVAEGLEEGIEILNSRTFERIESKDGLSVVCSRVKSFSFEAGGLKLEREPDSEHTVTADTVIFAAGQSPDCPESYGLTLTPRGLLEPESGENVFCCGDCVKGTASVIEAIAAGRDTAQAVDRYLGGDGDITERFTEPVKRDSWIGVSEGFAELERLPELLTGAKERAACFDACALPQKEGDVRCEAERCLQCDLRLQIPKMKFWSEYDVR